MHERDAPAVHADARLGVDQLEARRARVCERLVDVGDAVRDVVQSRAALGQELPHRRVLTQCRHQLDLAVSHPQERGFEAFLLVGRTMDEVRA